MAFLGERLRWAMVPMLMGVMLPAGTSADAPDEYQVKAAFLFNFAKFVEWPLHSFKSAAEPIAICILGENPFGEMLQTTVKGKLVDGRSFVIRQVRELNGDCTCHILFVAASERKRFLSMAQNRKIALLTIGEAQWFIPDGGVINFRLESGKVRFEINPDAAEQEQLRVSSKLLSLAQIVRR